MSNQTNAKNAAFKAVHKTLCAQGYSPEDAFTMSVSAIHGDSPLSALELRSLLKQVAKNSIPTKRWDVMINALLAGGATALALTTSAPVLACAGGAAGAALAYNHVRADRGQALRELTVARPKRSLLSRLSRWGSKKQD